MLILKVVLGLGVLNLAACASVAPYERETLSRSDMELSAHPELRAGEDHARSYREGSSGAGRARGGGCGCN
jgi:hypothetical protein